MSDKEIAKILALIHTTESTVTLAEKIYDLLKAERQATIKEIEPELKKIKSECEFTHYEESVELFRDSVATIEELVDDLLAKLNEMK
jgi:hypothetical protein